MNKVILMGRLTRDPEVKHLQGENPIVIARYTLAVDRRFKREGEQTADFIRCLCFGKAAEHAEKYYQQGLRVTICGRIQTGSYTNKEGAKIYTTEVVVEEHEFAEGRKTSSAGGSSATFQGESGIPTDEDGFMNIPDGLDGDLPFC